MTAPTLVPDATRCPDCRSSLPGTGSCPACGLRLTGPEAARLWEVDVELLALERDRRLLLDEREELLRALRTTDAVTAPAFAAPPPPAEWTPQRVQNLLLTLGGLLLAGAAMVFAVVTYERLGAGGRALVLASLTLAAGVAAPRLRARGLGSTAETVGGIALALAALDAYGLRTLGLAADSSPAVYAAGSAAVLAVGAGAYGSVAGLKLVRAVAVLLSQAPVPLLLADAEASAATTGLALAALAAADLAVLSLRRLPDEVAGSLQPCAVVVAGSALAASLLASSAGDEPGLAAAALVACAAVLAAGSRLAPEPTRTLLTAGAVVTVGAAVHALVRDDVPTTATVLAAFALAAVTAAAQLPRAERTGPVVGALLVAGAAVVLVGGAALEGALLPLAWLLDPWSLPAGAGARAAVAPGDAWTGPAVTPLVLLLAGVTAAVAGRALGRLQLAVLPVAALGLAAAVLLPLALDVPWPVAIGGLLVLAGVLAAAGAALLGRAEAVPLAAAGVLLALHSAAWSTASQTATLVVLPLVALGCAALAVPRSPLPAIPVALAGLLATAHVAALGAAAGLATDQGGALLLVAVTGAAAAAALLDGGRSRAAEATAVVAAVLSLALASTDVGWLSWVLAGLGLLALATALRPDRRAAAAAGGLLLSASSWVRLADAGITAPEPYVLPLAAVALVLGALRRRADPAIRSWAAYGPGLVLALVPSLLAGLDGDDLTRPLLVGLAALVVLLVGARAGLQAPLAVGAGVLVVVTLDLLGPYAAALPRWLSLGGAGALLLLVGATYERRRQDVARLRERYDGLT